MIHLQAVADAAVQRWRNGGGSTRELLTWPAADTWQLRISVADIETDGPFSAFPGVQRAFAVIEGAGVRLRFGQQVEVLTPDSEPLVFDGAAAPPCELLDGATRDLNLMVRSDAGSGSMQRAACGSEWISTAPLRALFTTGAVQLHINGQATISVAANTLAWSTPASGQRWRIIGDDQAPRAWWIEFRRSS